MVRRYESGEDNTNGLQKDWYTATAGYLGTENQNKYDSDSGWLKKDFLKITLDKV